MLVWLTRQIIITWNCLLFTLGKKMILRHNLTHYIFNIIVCVGCHLVIFMYFQCQECSFVKFFVTARKQNIPFLLKTTSYLYTYSLVMVTFRHECTWNLRGIMVWHILYLSFMPSTTVNRSVQATPRNRHKKLMTEIPFLKYCVMGHCISFVWLKVILFSDKNKHQ